jgi:5-methylcytosine-specific restriction endonuclease McrA
MIRDFYAFVKSKPCLRCGRHGTDVAHIETIISPKTGMVMPRSHKTLAKWGCVALCPDCHQHARDSIHQVNEEAFNHSLGRSPHYLWQAAASLLAEFNERGRR